MPSSRERWQTDQWADPNADPSQGPDPYGAPPRQTPQGAPAPTDPSNPSPVTTQPQARTTAQPPTPATPAAGAAPGGTRYNTTPNWQDPMNPPSPGDPYWAEWLAANPSYTGSRTGTYTSVSASTDPTAAIDQLYAKYGINDGGRGSGFADRAYWLEHPSEILNGRLAADLAGTGSDQPTGTPGTGPWQNSGKSGTGTPGPNGLLTGSADATATPMAMPAAQDPNAAMRDQFRQAILSQLGTLQNDKSSTDPNGPQLQPIISAYRTQSQRGLEQTRNAIAEANYAGGTANSGGMQTQEQRALEGAGANEANFTGQQVSQAVQARQQQLQHLLDVGAGFLSQGDQLAIQRELAQLQNQYQYAALGQQNNQFNNRLGYDYTSLQAQLNRDALMQSIPA